MTSEGGRPSWFNNVTPSGRRKLRAYEQQQLELAMQERYREAKEYFGQALAPHLPVLKELVAGQESELLHVTPTKHEGFEKMTSDQRVVVRREADDLLYIVTDKYVDTFPAVAWRTNYSADIIDSIQVPVHAITYTRHIAAVDDEGAVQTIISGDYYEVNFDPDWETNDEEWTNQERTLTMELVEDIGSKTNALRDISEMISMVPSGPSRFEELPLLPNTPQ